MKANEIQFSLRRPRSEKKEPHAPDPGRGKLPRITEVLALAIQFDDMIRRGVAKDYSELARMGALSKERISQIMRLIWLATDIQQEILMLPRSVRGRYSVNEVAARAVAGKRLWNEQREAWRRLNEKKLVA